jgi:hypothetical protein
MNYQEKFQLNASNAEYFKKQFDVLIMGLRGNEDERHTNFKKLISEFKGIIISLDTCDNAEKLIYKIENSDGRVIRSADNRSLIPDLQLFLKAEKIEGARVCIDITTLKQGVLFLLVRLLLKDIKPAILFSAYTEPLLYKKREFMEVGETEEYELYDKIMGNTKSVPGFTKNKSANEILLIAPMGFDSQRLQTICESLKPKKLIPVVGFPSFVPGWNLTAIKANYMVLKNEDCMGMVKSCEAASPFAMVNLLNEEFHRYNADYDIYVSPLGTRPHCLGAAIFASKVPSSYLIYDFPVEKLHRSHDVLKTNIYHLSKFIG